MNALKVTFSTLETEIIPTDKYSMTILNGSHVALLCYQRHNDMELYTPAKLVAIA